MPTDFSRQVYALVSHIPAGRVVFGKNLQTVAADWLTLAPRGFCVVEG